MSLNGFTSAALPALPQMVPLNSARQPLLTTEILTKPNQADLQTNQEKDRGKMKMEPLQLKPRQQFEPQSADMFWLFAAKLQCFLPS